VIRLFHERFDRSLSLVTLALSVFGILILYSAGQTDVPSAAAHVWQRQILWLVLSVVAAVLVQRVSPRLVEWAAPALYALGIVILLVTLAVGTGAGTAAGVKSWISIGGHRIGQPSEFVKLAVIVMLARYLAGLREPPASLRALLFPVGIAALPALLVALQPDLGSAIVFAGILFATLYWGGVRMRWLLLLASPVLSLVLAFSPWTWAAWIFLVGGLLVLWRPYVWEGLAVLGANLGMGILARPLWLRLAAYQQNRFLSFLNPELDARATGWHIIQSKIAIGSGGWLGQGFTHGPQKRLAFLPAQHTDFVFSVVGEELGLVGVLAALALFFALLAIIIRVARRAPEPFGGLVAFGVVGLLFTHIFESVGMTANVMPITGIPLPFFSYGGSFLLACFVAIGMVLRVARDGRDMGYRTV
jgi:rod shape determining protein RodA